MRRWMWKTLFIIDIMFSLLLKHSYIDSVQWIMKAPWKEFIDKRRIKILYVENSKFSFIIFLVNPQMVGVSYRSRENSNIKIDPWVIDH